MIVRTKRTFSFPDRGTVRLLVTLAALLGWTVLPLPAEQPASHPDLDALEELAMKAAVQKVAPSVVQIETTGGTDILETGPEGVVRKGMGPTTGLVVEADGYIISSAFNFANKPTAIFVQVPGHKDHYVAKVVATDQTRMLTLLRIEANGLPLPVAAPKKDFRVGQWSLALGRTWSTPEGPPSVSVGIISALDRIWGKAVQTDAKVSPVNYGGPLIDIQGRVQGVLVPASPRASGETAGLEWYDSGIGFAIPLEDVLAVLPRLKQGQDLNRGLLGVLLKGQDMFSTPPEIASVTPGSVAARAGIKPGDTITAIDGAPVVRQAQMMHALGNKYEGDVISLKVKRGDQEVNFPNLKLAGLQVAFAYPFLGILPVRDDPAKGVEVRYVYPQSPADKAGLKPGDRVLSLTQGKAKVQSFSGRDQLLGLLNNLMPGTEVQVEVRRQGDKGLENLTVKLGELPDTVPAKLPERASAKKALEAPKPMAGTAPAAPAVAPKEEDKKKAETGFLQRTNAAGDRRYWIYVPEDYDPNIAYALVVWLHPAHQGNDKADREFVNFWKPWCRERHIILVGPRAENETGWLFNEADFVLETVHHVLGEYAIDHERIVAHGQGAGGNLAFYLAFQDRDLIRGVAAAGAALAGPAKENVPNQRLTFFLVTGAKDPLAPAMTQTRTKLTEKKFPVVYHELPDRSPENLARDPTLLEELVRWIDSLDRL
ncbi:MAG: PDZ domain-containing protein [Planctomycetes bacterium]|nr:PDZ domain-containing protein [Planctomycetota bacterium]